MAAGSSSNFSSGRLKFPTNNIEKKMRPKLRKPQSPVIIGESLL